MKSLFLSLLLFTTLLMMPALDTSADVQLPNFAQSSDLKQDLEEKGANITDVLALIAGIAGVLSLVAAGIAFGVAQPDWGKRLLFGGIVGLVVASVAFGIAQLVA